MRMVAGVGQEPQCAECRRKGRGRWHCRAMVASDFSGFSGVLADGRTFCEGEGLRMSVRKCQVSIRSALER